MVDLVFKKHIRNNELTFALCDSDILGKKFEENNEVIDLTCNFFNGSVVNSNDLKKIIPTAKSGIAVGNSSAELIKELFDDVDVRFIDRIPMINIFRF